MRKPKHYDPAKVQKYLLSREAVGPNARGFVAIVHREPSCYSRHGGSPRLDFDCVKQVGKCWYCGKFFNMHGIVSELESSVKTFDDAEGFCISKFGNPEEIPDEYLNNRHLVLDEEPDELDIYGQMLKKFKRTDTKTPNIVTGLPEGYVPLFGPTADGSVLQSLAVNYAVHRRGVTPYRLRKMLVGIGTAGPWQSKLILPIFNIEGQLVTITSRNFTEANLPKSKTRHEGDKTCFYGINLAKDYDWGVLVEGPFDALVNRPNFVGGLGISLTSQQLDELGKWNPSKLFLMYDPEAGYESCKTAEKIYSARVLSGDLFVCAPLPRGTDPATAGYAAVQESIQRATHIGSRLDLSALQLEIMAAQ